MLNINIGVSSNFYDVYNKSPLTARLLLAFSNIIIVFQDLVMFSGVKNNQLVFVSNFWDSEIVLYQGLLVPQAWSLGVELAFYLLAPFLLTKKKILLLFFLLSLVVRFYLFNIGLGGKDPWTYRFFPAELAVFLLGALSHQFFYPYYKKISINNLNVYSVAATIFLLFITLIYWLIPINESIKNIVLLSVFAFFMPLAFIFQSSHYWDKWIGDLSYPIYICHMMVLNIVTPVFYGMMGRWIIGAIVVLLSIGFAIILKVFLSDPIEIIRKRFKVSRHIQQ